MAIYKKYTSTQSGVTLINKGDASRFGNIKKAVITNGHASAKTRVVLYIDDGAGNIFDLVHTVVPPRSSLVVTDNINFNPNKYDLKLSLLDAGYHITIIIK